jgi:hypothetical protein
MVDRAEAEAVINITAGAAFTYYPDKALNEPGYTLDEDLDWAVGPLRAIDPLSLESWRRRIAVMITDPTADRQSFIADVLALAEE